MSVGWPSTRSGKSSLNTQPVWPVSSSITPNTGSQSTQGTARASPSMSMTILTRVAQGQACEV